MPEPDRVKEIEKNLDIADRSSAYDLGWTKFYIKDVTYLLSLVRAGEKLAELVSRIIDSSKQFDTIKFSAVKQSGFDVFPEVLAAWQEARGKP